MFWKICGGYFCRVVGSYKNCNMILLELKQYLQQRGQVSLQELVRHFHTEPDTLRAMLAIMLRKGEVNKEMFNNARCNNCNKCDATALEIYRWVIKSV
jgi:predicted transcriptional regulator